MKGGSAKIWLSADIQAFFEWIQATAAIRAKNPMELATLNAHLLAGPEGERKPVFGDGRQDYMMQRYKNLALVQVSGTLVKNDSPWNKYFGLVSYDEIRRSVLTALTDNSVDGIVTVMNTPGGSAAGADAMASFFSKADQSKPLYAFAESDMCSGGYYLGAPAREIYAQRAAMVGSIGVVMVHYDHLKMYEDAGIKPTVFRAGEFKALGSQVEHLDEKAKASIQGMLTDYFNMFNEHVVANRGYKDVPELLASGGEGRVFMAEEAKEVGLVDQVAEMEDALEEMSGKASKATGRRSQFSVNVQERGTAMSRNAKAKAAAAAGQPLTPEQIAALAAGASLGDPADAGTAETGADGKGDEEEEEETPPGEGDGTKKDDAEEEEAPEGEKPEGDAKPQASAAAVPAVDLDRVIALSTEIGQLKAQLQTMETETAQIRSEAASKDALIENLRGVAATAINNRQVALGYQPSDAASLSAEQCFEMFGKLDADFKERFKAGAKSAATRAEVKPASLSPVANAARGMTKL